MVYKQLGIIFSRGNDCRFECGLDIPLRYVTKSGMRRLQVVYAALKDVLTVQKCTKWYCTVSWEGLDIFLKIHTSGLRKVLGNFGNTYFFGAKSTKSNIIITVQSVRAGFFGMYTSRIRNVLKGKKYFYIVIEWRIRAKTYCFLWLGKL